jgi:tRNA-specific 2-thiouridylase
VELVTIGQRKGLGLAGGGAPRYVVDVDVAAAVVTVGDADELLVDAVELAAPVWAVGRPAAGALLLAQTSAHGAPRSAIVREVDDDRVVVAFDEPVRRVAPGQSVVLYEADEVVGGGVVSPP